MQNTTPQDAIRLDDLRSIEEIVAENNKILSSNILRYQLRQRFTNGLADACVRIGNRVMISKTRYEHWLATQTDARRAAI